MQYRSQLIERAVNDYFKTYPNETFLGLVTVFNVVDAVFDTLNEFDFRWNAKVRGETFDQIRLLGPEGVDDLKFARAYGVNPMLYGGQVKEGAA